MLAFFDTIVLQPAPAGPPDAVMVAGNRQLACRVGKQGIRARKREGDNASPRAILRPVSLFYRRDRLARPRSGLPVKALSPNDGWCDAVGDRNYNRPVRLPYGASHERLWRTDRLYDLVVVLDWNMRPRRQGLGSAIFLHVARPDGTGTEGCLALPPGELVRLVARLSPKTRIRIGG